MITLAEIKRSGIEDVVRDYTPQQSESVRPLKTSGEHPLAELLKKYEAFLEVETYGKFDYGNFVREDSGLTDILAPLVINAFLQITIQYETHKRYV